MENLYYNNTMYDEPQHNWWHGRVDGLGPNHLRWHQCVRLQSLKQEIPLTPNGIALLGFACDEGVRRNRGRQGAAKGPEHIRRALSNLPLQPSMRTLYDFGVIKCPNGALETTQDLLAHAVTSLLASGNFPILLGGGHELAQPHYRGIKKFVNTPSKSIGIINFDAHFDLREPDENGVSSGTGFWEIAQTNRIENQPFHYLALGIQKTSNTVHLFNIAERLGVRYIEASDFHYMNYGFLQEMLNTFIAENDFLYLSIDMDVFASAFAPGVSATSYNGIYPDFVFSSCIQQIVNSKKVLSIGIAETNPLYDIDDRTAKLAASILMQATETLSNI
ncbi:formimidoylglutamase [Olivibacter sp. LS-1]|uniref:formimidoylglutamase n=1 Tax=unclassified Olivibacter TaxID=2632301 RepID=UPI0011EA808D|nr:MULTISPECIES: formimidoylglutamase [unclassified Olivibacter]MDM8175157.1 formimidoylglutamase [Olivibacter sp. 47]QEL01927.1 formimidoylglutamase [Olivibacter sp. LS-1]